MTNNSTTLFRKLPLYIANCVYSYNHFSIPITGLPDIFEHDFVYPFSNVTTSGDVAASPRATAGVHKLFHLRAACISLLLCTGRYILLHNILHNMISNKTFCKILIVLFNLNILHKKLIWKSQYKFYFHKWPCINLRVSLIFVWTFVVPKFQIYSRLSLGKRFLVLDLLIFKMENVCSQIYIETNRLVISMHCL